MNLDTKEALRERRREDGMFILGKNTTETRRPLIR
jgi:hypothetical protein